MFQPFYHPLRHAFLNDGFKLGGIESALRSLEYVGGFFGNDVTFKDYPISEIDLDFAVIYELGFSSTWDSARSLNRKIFLDSTTVRATAGGDVTSYNLTPRFFVVEFDHSLIVSMQHITPVFAASSNEQNETINEIYVPKTQIITAGFYVENDIYNLRAHDVSFYLTDSTTLGMYRSGAGVDDALYMSLFILEFK